MTELKPVPESDPEYEVEVELEAELEVELEAELEVEVEAEVAAEVAGLELLAESVSGRGAAGEADPFLKLIMKSTPEYNIC